MIERIRNRVPRLERALTAPEAEPAPTITGDMTPKEAAAAYADEMRRGLPPRRLVDMSPAEPAEAEAAYAATLGDAP